MTHIAARAFSVASVIPSRYTGKERDTESGLDYFGARYYASGMGRFMSPDWSEQPEPIPYVDMENPQSLNLYGYGLNNPLSNRDFSGHSFKCDPDYSPDPIPWLGWQHPPAGSTEEEEAN
ncbi:MAG: RHS repeat-associated core domain-containing protein [Acidobacteriota bacterium]|nr:RHS repeat-associated core domain-containing protein [Acidobacteriota bacterium]